MGLIGTSQSCNGTTSQVELEPGMEELWENKLLSISSSCWYPVRHLFTYIKKADYVVVRGRKRGFLTIYGENYRKMSQIDLKVPNLGDQKSMISVRPRILTKLVQLWTVEKVGCNYFVNGNDETPGAGGVYKCKTCGKTISQCSWSTHNGRSCGHKNEHPV